MNDKKPENQEIKRKIKLKHQVVVTPTRYGWIKLQNNQVKRKIINNLKKITNKIFINIETLSWPNINNLFTKENNINNINKKEREGYGIAFLNG